jgi:hypothetical protein
MCLETMFLKSYIQIKFSSMVFYSFFIFEYSFFFMCKKKFALNIILV